MLETRHSRATIKPFLAFVPRQVSLATRGTMKNEKASSKTLEADFNGEGPILKSSKKEKKKDKKESTTDLSLLLLSIAAFLKQHGYSKTLAAFQSETSIEELDGYKSHIMDLGTYYKFLATSQDDGKAEPNNCEALDFQKDGIVNKGKDKKKKKNKSIDAENVDQDGTGLLPEALRENSRYSVQSQGESSTVPLEETNMKCKDARKKKSKTISDSFDKDIEGGNPEDKKVVVKRLSQGAETLKPATENGHGNIHPDREQVKSKDKKRKNKLTSESSGGGEDMGKINIEKESATTLKETAVSMERKSSKKRKKLAAEDAELQPSGKIRSKEGKQGNMKGSQEDEGNDQQNQLSESENLAAKRRKIQNGDVDLMKPQEITPGKQLDGLTNGTVGSATQRSMKKQRNGSAEPKTVNAFQRVKVDEVKFADERLQDNSYWAKDGAEIGYGAKAQEVLGQVKGRDFRHEKTKKKRGSYRGGQIDLQTHSVKFQYSDDE